MAIAPPNEDAFLREVDDNLRHDQMVGFFRRWGRAIVGAVGVALLLLAAGLWWRNYRAKQAGADSEQLSVAIAPAASGGAIDAKALAPLTNSPRVGYRAAARLAEAGSAEAKGDAAGAARLFGAIAADSAIAQPLRDLATIRAVNAGFDTLAPAAVVDRLRGLAVPGNAYFASAAELTAIAWLKQNQPAKAAPLFAAIARDARAPASARGRAAAMATALGQVVETPALAAAAR